MIPTWRVLHGDALAVLRSLPEASAHCCVTSPPYWGLRDYEGVEPIDWPAVRYRPMPGLDETEVPAWSGILGTEPDPASFVGHLVLIYRELWRVLRPDGTAWVNLGDTSIGYGGGSGPPLGRGSTRPEDAPHRRRVTGYKRKDLAGIPWRVAFALEADGWWLRRDNVWWKPNALPQCQRDRPNGDHEYVFLLGRSARYFYDDMAVRVPVTGTAHSRGNGVTPKGRKTSRGRSNPSWQAAVAGQTSDRALRTVWSINTIPGPGEHFAAYPPALPDRCIALSTSAYGVCTECLAPWRRLTERQRCIDGKPADLGTWDTGNRPTCGAQGIGKQRFSTQIKTLGWEPGCECDAERIPATVIDPFSGTGQTGVAALSRSRSYIGIEPSELYVGVQRGELERVSLVATGDRAPSKVITGPLFEAGGCDAD